MYLRDDRLYKKIYKKIPKTIRVALITVIHPPQSFTLNKAKHLIKMNELFPNSLLLYAYKG